MGYRLPATTLRAVILADTEFSPVYAWQDGKRTDKQLLDESGRPLFRLTGVPAVFQGQADTVTLITHQPTTVTAGSVITVDPEGEAFAEVKGVSETGSRFVEQRLTITSDSWLVAADISDALI